MTKTARRDADDRAQIRGYRQRDVLRTGEAVRSTARHRVSLFDTHNSGGQGQFNWLGRTPLIFRSAQKGPDELVRQS